MESEVRKGSHRGLRPPPEKPAIYCTPSFSRARITASAPRMASPSSAHSRLQSCRVAITARIGRAHKHAALGITDDQLHFPVIDARATRHYPVSQGFEPMHRRFWHVCLDPQLHLPVERRRIRTRKAPPAGGFHGGLWIHTEINEIGEDLEITLRLMVAPWRTTHHDRLPVFGGHVAIQGVHRAFAWSDLVGMAWRQTKTAPGPVVEDDTGAGGDVARTKRIRQAVNPRHTIASAVSDAKIRRIAIHLCRL